MPDVTITVDGTEFSGWKRGSVTATIEAIAGSFELQAADVQSRLGVGKVALPAALLAAVQASLRTLVPGPEVVVKLDGETALTGYIDVVRPRYAGGEHLIVWQGRSKTADLVDCAAIAGAGQWNNRNLIQIGTDVCKPFGIKVETDQPDLLTPFTKFAIEDGETAFETLDRGARMRAVVAAGTAKGNVTLTRASKIVVPTSLVRGKNIERAEAEIDWTNRYSKYVAKAHEGADDLVIATATAALKAEVEDTEIGRYRPTVVLAEAEATLAALKSRATIERNIRAGRSAKYHITVKGWSHDAGLWVPNRLVHVSDDYLGIEGTYLIATVQYNLAPRDEGGSTAVLTLMRPEAFTAEPLKPPKKSKGGLLG